MQNEESKVETCPRCGSLCNDDVTIADHGHCYDCHKAWQFGEWPEQETGEHDSD